MELRQLEHVLAVIETGSLTAAASRVGLTQVANSMPCTVEIGGKEMWSLTGRLLRPSVIWLMLKALFQKSD